MNIDHLAQLVAHANALGASDLHLEAGLPATVRIRGTLRTVGDPLPAEALDALTRQLVQADDWAAFQERCSADLARVIAGVRCRINVLMTSRGPGVALRLLSGEPPTLERLNLHPDLAQIVEAEHGLVLVTGPTGSGKSSTLAALLEHVNETRSRVIVTIEQPIEYGMTPKQCFIRRREVGHDTPSFEQGLLDALREDIDVLMVGEMRTRDTMRLTMDACETGHLVLATLHASTTIEALQRIVSAFPAAEQPSVCSQLADVLHGVVAQRLRYRDELGIRVPECEVLRGTSATRGGLRQGQLFRLRTALDTGAAEGMWSFDRYRRWLDGRKDWYVPAATPGATEPPPIAPLSQSDTDDDDRPLAPRADDVIVIEPPEEASVRDLLSELDDE